MKMFYYKSFIILWVFCIIPLISGCNINPIANAKSNPSTEIHVSYWYTENDVEKPGVLKLVQDFNNLGVQVSGQTVVVDATQKGFFNAQQDYITAYVANNEPNLFRAARDWVSQFGYAEMIQPLEGFFNQSDVNDFITESIRMCTYIDAHNQSHLFAIPQQLDAAALMFNKHILEQAGINTTNLNFNTSWTWPEFMTNLNLIYNNTGVYGYTMAGMDFGAQAIFFGTGGELFYNNTVSLNSVALNSTQTRYALQYIKNLVDSPVTPPYALQGWNTINPDFAGGTVAMIQQGPWQLKDFLDNSPEFNPNVTNAKPYAGPNNLGFMEFPKDSQGHQGVPLGMQSYVISSRVKGDLLTATVDFLKYITTEQAEIYQAVNYFHVPPRLSAYNDTAMTLSPSWYYLKGFKANIDTAATLPVHYQWAKLETAFANELDTFLAGKQDMNTMISRIIDQWSVLIPSNTGSQSSLSRSTATDFGTIFFLLGFVPVLIFKLNKRKNK